jgi:hypothetical protein
MRVEGAVSLQLTDDQIWSAIVENTNALSVLIEQHLDVPKGTTASDLEKMAELQRSRSETINKFECEYRDYIAELRRRHLNPASAGQ